MEGVKIREEVTVVSDGVCLSGDAKMEGYRGRRCGGLSAQEGVKYRSSEL